MTCPACDYELSFQSETCENCGAPIYLATAGQTAEWAHCTYCGARATTGEDHCLTCGLKKNFRTRDVVVGTCRNCGGAWRQVWLYCQVCGVARENGLVDTLMPITNNRDEAVGNPSPFSLPEDPPYQLDAPELLSESELVERLFANDVKRDPAILQNGTSANSLHATASAAAPSTRLLPDVPPATENAAARTTLASEPVADTAPATPVQTVRYIDAAHKRRASPVDKGLIKIIGVLIGLILLFSALIVSGFRVRDLFSRTPLRSQPSVAPRATATPIAQKSVPPAPDGMVYVPGGSFQMGAGDSDSYVSPAHEVTVAPFFMDRTEVTNEQYAAFLQATNHAAPPDWPAGAYATGTAQWPVVQVSWQDATAYATWVGKRLPTEAEWEFAARSGDGRRYPWGTDWDASLTNTSESNLNHPVAVGSYVRGANPLGLFDLAGNVWEWTASDVVSYKNAQIILAPGKVIRGGAFYAPKERASTVYRGFAPPDKRARGIGFRCVQDVK